MHDEQPVGLADPDMPEQQLRLYFGELTTQGVRDVRAAIRFANSRRLIERESLKAPITLDWIHNVICDETFANKLEVEGQYAAAKIIYNQIEGGDDNANI